MIYKTVGYWDPTAERSLLWNDPDLGIPWPLHEAPILSAKDRAGVPLRAAEVYS